MPRLSAGALADIVRAALHAIPTALENLSAHASDVAQTNLTAILAQQGLEIVRSL